MTIGLVIKMAIGLVLKMARIIVQGSNTTSVNSSADYRRLKDIAVAISLTVRRRTTAEGTNNRISKLFSSLVNLSSTGTETTIHYDQIRN